MYHQVRVPEEDRDFLRFLWWPNGDTSQEPVPYRMTVHLFGAISSPSCAAYALKRTAQENESEFPAMVIETLQQNFYVDDCLKSAATETEAIHLIHDLIALCGKGGFVLEKWISNSRVVLQAISKEQRAKELKMLDLDIDKLPVERALGLQWCVETDAFKFKMEVKHQALTRRGMLSVNSSVYDPLGFLAPVTLHAKIMQQELCKRGCSWDDSLPQDIWQRWKKWLEELELLATFSVDRCIKPADFTVLKQAQLHHFSDASEEGYGIVSYIRMVDQKGHIHVAFLLGKARVTPLKAVTIPRLELSAAVLAAKMNTMIKAELGVPLQESVFWTDSTSVLKYVNNEDRRFHTFVANRIATIRDLSDPKQWRHVSTKENPADYVSRGMKVSDFLSSRRWLEGPEFLWKEEEKWPKVKLDVSLDAGDKEVKRRTLHHSVLPAAEVHRGSRSPDENNRVSRQSSIHMLDPVLQDGLLRVGGRLNKAAMPDEAKHPLILTKDQHISSLILKNAHQTLGHAGHLIHDLIALCGKGGFVLEKWISNSRVVLQAISKEQRAKELKMLDLDIDKLPVERALGLQWCVETDAFKFKMEQELCKRGCSWDDSLPQDIWQRWKKWLEELELLATFSVDRCIKPADFTVLKQAQLHHFSDASEEGYGIVSYIRMVDQKGHIHVAFLLGKARVTPLKAVTIPRLELSAAVLAAKMNTMIKAELGVPLQESVFWTDSTSVLKYVNN
ncbi:hypothetical protein WMY93_027960 [Mugilogobius chulae]|uniref:Uncharacterized protein n=1 Tax=Mugilogobius chulae TaxID=88201 RepID=A0AAW0N074_9GOBI